MNYPLRCAVIDFFTGVIDAYQLRRVILHPQEVYPAPFYYSLMNLLGSHDRVRILNAMCGLNREGAAQMDRAEAKKITLGKRELKSAKKALSGGHEAAVRPARRAHRVLWRRDRHDRHG